MPKVVDPEQRRAELAEAVWRLAAQHGVEAITVRRVAAETGWSTGALVHYFSDKESLLLFAFETVAMRAGARMAGHRDLPPRRRARAVLAEALPLDEERRAEVRVWFGLLGLAVTRPALARAQRRGYQNWRAELSEALEEGGLGGPDQAAALVAFVDGMGVQAFCDPRAWPPAKLERLLDMELDALV